MKDVLKIEDGVLKECMDKDVKSVVIPEGVTEIGWYAFDGCESLASVSIPSSVTKIGESAFSGCKSLSSVEIPSSVTEIGTCAFEYCTSLESVEFGGTVAQWEAVKGKQNLLAYIPASSVKCSDGEWQKPVLLVENGVAVECLDRNATSVTIPEGVTEIGKQAFWFCESLSSVVIPSSVTEIGDWAFKGCKSLASVAFGGTMAQWDAVKGKIYLFNGDVPATGVKCADGEWQKPVLNVENGVVVKCLDRNATSVTIPEGVTKIGGYAFSGCKSLSLVEIPSSVTKIGGSAFSGCTSLSSVEFGGTVAQLEAVKGKENLCEYLNAKSVKCADGEWQKLVVHVENGVALECLDRNATSVTIPEGVTAIGGDAFWGAFEDCESLSSVVIPSSVTEIGKDAFRGCTALESVEFGGTVAQWKSVKKMSGWHYGVPATTVKCADGAARL